MKGRTSDAKNMLTSLQRKYKLKSTTQTGRRHPAGKKASHKPLVSESTSYNVIHQKAFVFVSPHLSSPESHTTNHRACPVSWKTGVNTSCLTWFILGEDSWDDNGGNQKNPHVQKAPYINSFSTEDRTRRCCCWNSLYGRKKKKKKVAVYSWSGSVVFCFGLLGFCQTVIWKCALSMVIVCLPLLASEVASSLQHKTSFVLLIAISSAISVNSGFALIYVCIFIYTKRINKPRGRGTS